MVGENTTCRPCKGSGRAWGVGVDYCPLCHGDGVVPNEPLRTMFCAPCKGSGRRMAVQAAFCDICSGYGSIEPPQAQLAEQPGSDVYFVRGGEPYTDRKLLASVLEELRGDVCVCDPYYGPGVLSALANLKDYKSVRCLTRYLGDAGKAVADQNASFCPSNSDELHDRYVLADNGLLLLGHGLKDFGIKETFLIMLDEEFAPMEAVKATFETHWAAAAALG